MIKQTLYEILGVPQDASTEVIKKAYRELSFKNHPDRLGDNSMQSKINNAYEVLSDPIRRELYDKTGAEKNTDYDLKVQGFLQNIFLNLINQQEDPTKIDLIGQMRRFIYTMIEGVEKSISDSKKSIIKYDKVVKKLKTKGDTNLITLLNRQIDELNKNINANTDYSNFMLSMVTVVEDYEFDFESEPNYSYYINA